MAVMDWLVCLEHSGRGAHVSAGRVGLLDIHLEKSWLSSHADSGTPSRVLIANAHHDELRIGWVRLGAMTAALLCGTCSRPITDGQRFCGNCGADVSRSLPSDSAEVSSVSPLVEALRRATLGEYEIREEIGRGGMAFVFLAHDISLGRKVALKALAPHLHMVPGMSPRFLREAQTAAGLEHPNIIPIYARRASSDVAFFTMRYVAGVALSTLSRQVGPLPVAVVRSLMANVGGALAFAHSRGVLHRDVKPGNVMLASDASVFVTDFGIAKQAESAGLTETGQLLGTPGYMSPEQCRGRDVSHASDQYSLGAMVFELLAGRPPFIGSNAMDVMAQQMTELPPDLLSLRPDCPRDLAQVVRRMLSKEPVQRFPSIDEAMRHAKAAPLAFTDSERQKLVGWIAAPANKRDFSVTPVSPTPLVSDVVAGGGQNALGAAHEPGHGEPRSNDLPLSGNPGRGTTVSATVNSGSRDQGAIESQPVSTSRTSVFSRRFARWWMVAASSVAILLIVLAVRWFRPPDPPAPPQPEPEAMSCADTPADPTCQVAVAPTAGFLALGSVPSGAVVRVDGGSPVSGTLVEVDSGSHRVQVAADGYEVYETDVEIALGDTVLVLFAGKRIPPPPPPPPPVKDGVLRLRVEPFAKIFVDGQLKNEDLLHIQSIRPGRHRLRLEKTGHTTIDTVVTITPGDTLTLKFEMLRETP